jgi:hypothetical protein
MTDLSIGANVRLIARPPYLKTADPMPMLRPPDLLAIADEGVIVDCRPAGYWGVKFSRGIFLLEAQYLEVIVPAEPELIPEET